MNELVAYGTAALALLVAAYAGWHMLKSEPLGNGLFYAVAGLEIVVLAVTIGACVALARTDSDVDGVLFVSYLLTMLIIAPAAVLWGIAEKSRWGTGVVVVAMLTVAILTVRAFDIWTGAYV